LHLFVLAKKFWKFFRLFILWIRDFIKEFPDLLFFFSGALSLVAILGHSAFIYPYFPQPKHTGLVEPELVLFLPLLPCWFFNLFFIFMNFWNFLVNWLMSSDSLQSPELSSVDSWTTVLVLSARLLVFFSTVSISFNLIISSSCSENSWKILKFLLGKIDIWNTKHFQNSIVDYLLFNFLVFLTSFFLFYLPIVVIKFLKFLCFLLYWSEILSKNSPKLWVFFQENLKYLKSKISPKFHNLLFLSYFFSIFDIFFSISPIQTCEKIIDFFVVFYWKD